MSQQIICPVCRKPMHLEYGDNGQDIWCHATSDDHYECERLREPEATEGAPETTQKSLAERINSLWTGKESLPCGCPANSEYVYFNSEKNHCFCVKCGAAYKHESQLVKAEGAPIEVDMTSYSLGFKACQELTKTHPYLFDQQAEGAEKAPFGVGSETTKQCDSIRKMGGWCCRKEEGHGGNHRGGHQMEYEWNDDFARPEIYTVDNQGSGTTDYYLVPEVEAYMDALESRNAELEKQIDKLAELRGLDADAYVSLNETFRKHVYDTVKREEKLFVELGLNTSEGRHFNERAEKAEREVERLKSPEHWCAFVHSFADVVEAEERAEKAESQLFSLTHKIEEMPLKVPAHVVVGKFDDEPFYLAKDVEGYLRGVKE